MLIYDADVLVKHQSKMEENIWARKYNSRVAKQVEDILSYVWLAKVEIAVHKEKDCCLINNAHDLVDFVLMWFKGRDYHMVNWCHYHYKGWLDERIGVHEYEEEACDQSFQEIQNVVAYAQSRVCFEPINEYAHFLCLSSSVMSDGFVVGLYLVEAS